MKRLQLLLLLLIAHLDKEHPIAEAKTKLVKELDVFQQVVVAGTSVTVLVVVPRFDINKKFVYMGTKNFTSPVDKQLDNRLHIVGGDQGLLLPLAGDQGHPAYRHHVRALGVHLLKKIH